MYELKLSILSSKDRLPSDCLRMQLSIDKKRNREKNKNKKPEIKC